MDMVQLKYFISAAQTLNFTKAAQQQYITQPAISRQISELEDSLKVKLFVRDHNKVMLTSEGKEFYHYAVDLLSLAQSAEARMHSAAAGKTGHIRISALPSSTQTLTRCISAFTSEYPGIQIDISISTGSKQLNLINSGSHDFYFSFVSLLETAGSLQFLLTEEDRFCLYVHRNEAAQIDPNDFSTLTGLTLLTEFRETGPLLVHQIDSICEARSFVPYNTQYYDSFLAVMVAVNSGVGFSMFPHFMAETSYMENAVSMPIPGDDAIIPNAIAWHQSMANSAAEKFLETVKRLYPNSSVSRSEQR